MIINKQLKDILSTGDEEKINEVVATSLEMHKNYDVASQTPNKWCIWANVNPRDALRLMNQWVGEGRDVSMFADYYKPDLTPCETFANALGYAKHLNLKEFLFRNYGSYTYAMHTYSTTKVRNIGGNGTAPIGKSAIGNDRAYDDYASRFNNGPENEPERQTYGADGRTQALTRQENDNMSIRSINRSDQRFNNAKLDKELARINEVKKIIKKAFLKEIKRNF